MGEKGMNVSCKRGLLGSQTTHKVNFCEHCIFDKQKRVSFSITTHHTKCTKWEILIENQVGKKVKRLQTDNGLEFCETGVNEFCEKEGIARHHVIPKAASIACYLVNRSLHASLDGEIPEEIWPGYHGDMSERLEIKIQSSSLPSCSISSSTITVDNPPRQRKPTRRYIEECDFIAYAFNVNEEVENSAEPKTYSEAISSTDSFKCLASMQEEVESLHKNKTWDLVQLPEDKRVINFAARNVALFNELKAQISSEFDMKNIGVAKKILGMEISMDRKLWLSEKKFIAKCDEDKRYMDNVPYANAVGSVMYAIVCTRADLAHAVSGVSRLMHNPGKDHWSAIKWIIRYLKCTVDFGLVFDKSCLLSDEVTGYLVSYTSVYCFFAYYRSEYIAASEGVKEATWLRGLVNELGLKQDILTVFCDSQSVIHLTKGDRYHNKTQHIDVKRHFIRGTVAAGHIMVKKIHTVDKHTNMLTEPFLVA
ncbi:uncharacterized protein LOC141649162 [Silene latifolia]|uniref:uncharacterized protein LOC141649162 n=1 Tax=Silene latifolia TaxID=37657 RepID=UPI003D76F0B7